VRTDVGMMSRVPTWSYLGEEGILPELSSTISVSKIAVRGESPSHKKKVRKKAFAFERGPNKGAGLKRE